MADGWYFTLIHMVVVLARVTLINYSHHVFLNKEEKKTDNKKNLFSILYTYMNLLHFFFQHNKCTFYTRWNTFFTFAQLYSFRCNLVLHWIWAFHFKSDGFFYCFSLHLKNKINKFRILMVNDLHKAIKIFPFLTLLTFIFHFGRWTVKICCFFFFRIVYPFSSGPLSK